MSILDDLHIAAAALKTAAHELTTTSGLWATDVEAHANEDFFQIDNSTAVNEIWEAEAAIKKRIKAFETEAN